MLKALAGHFVGALVFLTTFKSVDKKAPGASVAFTRVSSEAKSISLEPARVVSIRNVYSWDQRHGPPSDLALVSI